MKENFIGFFNNNRQFNSNIDTINDYLNIIQGINKNFIKSYYSDTHLINTQKDIENKIKIKMLLKSKNIITNTLPIEIIEIIIKQMKLKIKI